MKHKKISLHLNGKGVTLLELIFACVIFIVAYFFISGFFSKQQKNYHSYITAVKLRQDMHNTVTLINNDAVNAGFHTADIATIPPAFRYHKCRLTMFRDLDGDNNIGDDNDSIAYIFDTVQNKLYRESRVCDTLRRILIMDQVKLCSLNFYDRSGTPVTSTANQKNIAKVDIVMSARAMNVSKSKNAFYDSVNVRTTVTKRN